MPHNTPRPPLVDDGPQDGHGPQHPRITTGDVQRLTTRAERTGKLTAHEVLELTRERKAAELKTPDARSVPRAGIHDGQDPDGPRNATELEALEARQREAAADRNTEQAADAGFLEQNGYAAVRTAMLGVCKALGAIPPEAFGAALAYNAAAVRRLRLNTTGDPRAAEALKAAQREARYLEAVARMHRDLRDLEERMAAGDRVTAR